MRRVIIRAAISCAVGVLSMLGVPYLPLHFVVPDDWLDLRISYVVADGEHSLWFVTTQRTWNSATVISHAYTSRERAESMRQSVVQNFDDTTRMLSRMAKSRPGSIDMNVVLDPSDPAMIPTWAEFRALDPTPYRMDKGPDVLMCNPIEMGSGFPFVYASGVILTTSREGVVQQSRSNMLTIGPILLYTKPHWPGLIANLVFYSAIACGLMWLATTLRGVRRVRRSLCRACAYDLRGLDADASCPECGNETRKKS